MIFLFRMVGSRINGLVEHIFDLGFENDGITKNDLVAVGDKEKRMSAPWSMWLKRLAKNLECEEAVRRCK